MVGGGDVIFSMKMKNSWSKKFIILIILRPGNGSRMNPTFSYTRKQIKFLTLFDLYLVQDIIFDVRIEILALTSIHLDIHNGLLECEFYTCTWPASNGLQVARYHFCYEN